MVIPNIFERIVFFSIIIFSLSSCVENDSAYTWHMQNVKKEKFEQDIFECGNILNIINNSEDKNRSNLSILLDASIMYQQESFYSSNNLLNLNECMQNRGYGKTYLTEVQYDYFKTLRDINESASYNYIYQISSSKK